jgi:hypothetical protein
MSLCFRCEYRAQYLETGSGPRCECQEPTRSGFGCYMYRPTSPVVLAKSKGDKRPQFAGSMFSARSRFAGVAKVDYSVKKVKGGNVLYCIPVGVIKNDAK